jgi:hypothetical protein
MTDVENLEKIISDIFGVQKIIKNKNNSNACIAPLNRYPLNLFAFNFMNRLSRLAEKFAGDKDALNTITDRIKNLGEATESSWAGPYSELVALDFYSQFSEFFKVSYINILPIAEHEKSIPALNGQKEKIDIDLCLNLRHDKIYTDVKSFNCIHQLIFERIFESIETFARDKLGKTILIGVDNMSSLDYVTVKQNLVGERKYIEELLKMAVTEGRNFMTYSSKGGLQFNFKIEYSSALSTVKEYSPFAMAEAYKYKFIDYGSKLLDNEYSMITMVRNNFFNTETVDFGNFNNIFYRSLSRRTFMELHKMRSAAQKYSSNYKDDSIRVSDVSKNLAGIIFIDDNSMRSKYYKSLYSAYIYLNPNYINKAPLTIRKLEKYFHNDFEVQIKDFDDFKWDNY